MGKGSGPVIGFRYSMGLHMGLCVGPVDALLQINGGDDKVAYSTPITSSTAFVIYKPELYGGDKKEGGINGSGWVMMGEATQVANPYLSAELGTPMPAFRGLCTVVFNGEVGALSPYIKAWAFKVRKTKAGWRTPVWQPTLCEIDVGSGIKAMNAAHLLYRCITDPVTGLGKPESALDLDRMLVAAQTLFDEGLGLCLRWSRSQVLGNFLATICTHVGGIWAEDPSTGKQYLKLLRGDYDIDTCVAVDETNVVELQSYQPQAITGSVNEVTVTYHSPITNKDASLTVHNLANIQAQGHTINQANTYPGIPTADLATRTAERDVRATSSLPVKVKLVVKSSVVVAKGDVLAFSWADLKVVKMPIRVMEIDRGGPTDSSITLDCVQDVYALPTASYIVAQPGLWVPPNTTPAPLAYQRLIEATWRDISMRMSAGDLAQVDASSAYIGALGVEPSGVVAYDYTMKSRVSGAPDYLEVAAGTFAPTGTLIAAMPCEAGPTAVSLADPQRLDEVEVGDEVLIDYELMRVTAIDPVAATATLARGCVDTVPAIHSLGARVWFTDRHTGADPTEYLDGETVQAKLLMRTSSGTLDESLATALSATLEARQALPYPPAGLTVNGSVYPASVIEPLSLAWVARNRLTQADQLVDTTAGTIAAEVGTTYTVRVYLNGVLDSTTTGITALTASPAVSGYGQLRVEIDAVRGGLASYQPLTASFVYRSALQITTASVSIGTGAGSTATLVASGGTAPYSWAVSPALPAGLTLDTATGIITNDGTAALGPASRTFTVTAADSQHVDKSIAVSVGAAPKAAWRYYVTAVSAASGSCIFGGCEMRATPGGADQTTGGSAFSSSTRSDGWAPATAFDGTAASASVPDSWSTISGDTTLPDFLGYLFDAPVAVDEVTVRASLHAGFNAYAPKNFKIQSSADTTNGADGTWDDEWSVSDQTGWSAGEVRTFTRP